MSSFKQMGIDMWKLDTTAGQLTGFNGLKTPTTGGVALCISLVTPKKGGLKRLVAPSRVYLLHTTWFLDDLLWMHSVAILFTLYEILLSTSGVGQIICYKKLSRSCYLTATKTKKKAPEVEYQALKKVGRDTSGWCWSQTLWHKGRFWHPSCAY